MTDKGFTDQVKGKVKETTGHITGNDTLKTEGLVDQAIGKAKETAADIKDAAQEVVEKATDALKQN